MKFLLLPFLVLSLLSACNARATSCLTTTKEERHKPYMASEGWEFLHSETPDKLFEEYKTKKNGVLIIERTVGHGGRFAEVNDIYHVSHNLISEIVEMCERDLKWAEEEYLKDTREKLRGKRDLP